MRQHADELIAVPDIMPAAIGDRRLNSAERRKIEAAVYQALHKLAKRGTLRRDGQGAKTARFRLAGEA